MIWDDELAAITTEAAGDLGLLVALRKVENGGEGCEFGVKSIHAPTYADQLHVAAVSFRHRERLAHMLVREPDGFYTTRFLEYFSSRWAPIGVENDPQGLNRWHSKNLITRASVYAAIMREAISRLE